MSAGSPRSPRASSRAQARAQMRARERRPWWRGGSSLRRWNGEMLGWALLALGSGLLLGGLFGAATGTIVLWTCMVAAVLLAFRRGIPHRLLQLRAVDVLYGVVLGGMLRIVQGWLAVGFGGSGALPSYPSLNGGLPPLWWLEDLLGAVLVAPVIEEFFFRGLLLIVVFTLISRLAGGDGAGIVLGGSVAVIVSAALFTITHQLAAPTTAESIVSLALVGAACGILVVCTGRIWPAVLVHVVYNGSGVLLTVAGTLLG